MLLLPADFFLKKTFKKLKRNTITEGVDRGRGYGDKVGGIGGGGSGIGVEGANWGLRGRGAGIEGAGSLERLGREMIF